MANNHCEDLGIPEHLHQNDRPVKPHFDDGEKIYRRLAPEHLEGNRVVEAAFDSYDTSVNREKYSQDPGDVLFNIVDGNHYRHWGVAWLRVSEIEILRLPHPVLGDEKIHTFKLMHQPEECMYPHSEMSVRQGDKTLTKRPKSGKVRTQLKERLSLLSKVAIRPTPPKA